MTVSIIVPLYNKARFIERALKSVLAQILCDFELIVVDDGSTDGGEEIVARCTDPRVKLIRQQNAGPGAARNVGIREAQAEFVAFLDADDEWLPDYLALACGYLQAHQEVAAISMGHNEFGKLQSILDDRWDSDGILPGRYSAVQISPKVAVRLLAYMSPCSTVCRKSVITRFGGFFEKSRCLYGEDAYLWLQVLLNETVAVSREPLVIFHNEASDLSHNLKGPHSIEPFLIDPSNLYGGCPPKNRPLLERVLAIRAVETACHYATHDRHSEARKLLLQFCVRHRPSMFWHTLAYCTIPQAVPLLRWFRKSVLNTSR